MKRDVKVTCPLDCFDICGLVATVEDGRVTRVKGDRDHPLTQGYICRKGRELVTRHNHPERLRQPMVKTATGWKILTVSDAINLYAEKLSAATEKYGSRSILNYSGSGYGGLSKTCDETFFNCMGGATVPRGSLCWAAGNKATSLDFGEPRSHHPSDIENANVILLWGRNPHATNLHMSGFLKKASDKGAHIVLIDPLKTETASAATRHLSVSPSTDGLLAMAMAHHIIETDLIDKAYIQNHVIGFNRYWESLNRFTPEFAEKITGISAGDIRDVASLYANGHPSAIVLGYGMQRYRNGGNNVRAINALAAITGNIGKKGGGVSYSAKSIKSYIRPHWDISRLYLEDQRSFSVSQFGRFLQEADDPPVTLVVVSKANPLIQSPDANRVREAFNSVDYKVVIDHFMTDTAANADLVIPATSVFEEEDLFFNSMYSPYLSYSEKAVDPPEGVIGEFDLYNELASRMSMECYPSMDRNTFFEKAISPITERFGITMTDLRQKCFSVPDSEIPWKDGCFFTTSGKYELWSDSAKSQGLSPLPDYIPPVSPPKRFPLRLITPHKKNSLHSQHFAFNDELTQAFASPDTLKRYGVVSGSDVVLESGAGKMSVRMTESDSVPPETVKIFEGWWFRNGAVNILTDDHISDMGEQAAFYDCFVTIIV